MNIHRSITGQFLRMCTRTTEGRVVDRRAVSPGSNADVQGFENKPMSVARHGKRRSRREGPTSMLLHWDTRG